MILNQQLAPKANEKVAKILHLLDKALRPYDILILQASNIEAIQAEDSKIKANLLQIQGGVEFLPFLIRWGSKNKKTEVDIRAIFDWFEEQGYLSEVSLRMIEGSRFDLFILQDNSEKKSKKKKSLETQLEEAKETFNNE